MSVATNNDDVDVYHPDWLAYEASIGSRRPPVEDFDVAIAGFNQASTELAKQWPSLEDQLNVTEETIEADRVRVRIYQPKRDSTDLPLMVYFHGGGLLMGNLDTEDPHCRILAVKTPCIVVNVDYPLAPKHTMDQIFHSNLKSIHWVRTHVPPLTTSPKLLVAGGSAGACIAVQLTYHYAVSATSDSPSPISSLVAMFPIASPSAVTPYTGRYSEMHKSVEEKATRAPCLEKKDMAKMCNIPQMCTDSPAHFPLLAPHLPLFPRTYIMNAEHDPARDDGTVLAKRLAEEGGGTAVRHDFYPGMPHWFHWIPSIPEAHRMMENTVAGVRWILEA